MFVTHLVSRKGLSVQSIDYKACLVFFFCTTFLQPPPPHHQKRRTKRGNGYGLDKRLWCGENRNALLIYCLNKDMSITHSYVQLSRAECTCTTTYYTYTFSHNKVKHNLLSSTDAQKQNSSRRKSSHHVHIILTTPCIQPHWKQTQNTVWNYYELRRNNKSFLIHDATLTCPGKQLNNKAQAHNNSKHKGHATNPDNKHDFSLL